MLKAPKFWYKKNDTYLSNSLYPLSILFRIGTKLRNIVSRKSCNKIDHKTLKRENVTFLHTLLHYNFEA